MAGVAGILSIHSGPTKDKLKAMLAWLKPVFSDKPEDEKLDTFQNISVGATGKNFYAANKKHTITLYWYGKLLSRDKISGILQNTNHDSLSEPELLLHAYEAIHTDLFHLIEGSFTLLIQDKEKEELYIARDRLGETQLFWYADKSHIFFASNLKAILATGLVSATPDLQAMATYLFLGYVSQDTTMIQGMNRLLPGYYLKISFTGKLSIHSFWSFSSFFSKSTHKSTSEVYDKIADTIEESVRKRIETTSNPPAILSGTIGSDLLEQTIKKQTIKETRPAVSYSIAFQAQEPHHFISPHTSKNNQVTITPETFLENLIPLIWSLELPIASIEAMVDLQFMKACQKNHMTPFLDTGFEQEFYDYTIHETDFETSSKRRKRVFTRLFNSVKNQFLQLLLFSTPDIALGYLRKKQEHDPRLDFMEKQALLSEAQLKACSPALGNLFHLDLFIHQFYNLPRIPTMSASLFYLNIKTYVIDAISEKRSRIAQNFGIFPQSPFLDLDLLEFLASLSPDAWESPDVLASFPSYQFSHLESPMTTNNEQPDTLLWAEWVNHPEIAALFSSLQRGLLVESGFISKSWLRKCLKDRKGTTFRILYSVLILELWMRLFIDLPMSQANVKIPLKDLLQVSI